MKNKMELNNKSSFFKITKYKIMLSLLVLIVILGIIYLYNSSFTTIGFELHSNPIYSGLMVLIAWPFILILGMAFNTQSSMGLLIGIAIVLELLYIYLIACIISKIRGK